MFVLPQNSRVETYPHVMSGAGATGGNEVAGMGPREGAGVPITEAPAEPSPFRAAWTQREGGYVLEDGSHRTRTVLGPDPDLRSEL